MTNTDKQQSLLQAFETERLIITPLAPEHQALYISLYTDAKIMRKIAPPLTLEQAQACFELALKNNKSSSPKQLLWVIKEKFNQQMIGIEGLTFDQKQANQAEIGIMLSRLAHGKNISTEAIKGLNALVKQNGTLQYIFANFNVTNYAVKKLAIKTGFVPFKSYKKHTSFRIEIKD